MSWADWFFITSAITVGVGLPLAGLGWFLLVFTLRVLDRVDRSLHAPPHPDEIEAMEQYLDRSRGGAR